MRTEHIIDGYAVTMPHDISIYNTMPPVVQAQAKTQEQTNPQRGYTGAMRFNPFGLRVSYHETRRDMGHHWQYGGAVLQWFRDNTRVRAIQILRWCMAKGGRVSRIDVAIDIYGSGVTWKELQSQMPNIVTKAKSAPQAKDAMGGGWTQYIGKRASQRMLRIYDKGAQTGSGLDHIRVELEAKGNRARSIAHSLANDSDSMGGFIRAEIVDFCDFPGWGVWNDAMASESQPAQKTGRKETDTRAWLIHTVAPVLAREYARDETLLSDFERALWDTYHALTDEG